MSKCSDAVSCLITWKYISEILKIISGLPVAFKEWYWIYITITLNGFCNNEKRCLDYYFGLRPSSRVY
jgi:hypothetical protein